MEIQRNEPVQVRFGSLSNGEVFEHNSELYMRTYPQNGAIRYAVRLEDGELISSLTLDTQVTPFLCKLVEVDR